MSYSFVFFDVIHFLIPKICLSEYTCRHVVDQMVLQDAKRGAFGRLSTRLYSRVQGLNV